MKTPRFTEKLDALPETISMFADYDASGLAAAIASGRGRHAFVVGSGGSAIAAEYLARCRETLSFGPTTVQTPMQVVLGTNDLKSSDVWLFSAGATNPDVTAAARSALDRHCRAIHIVTRSPAGEAASIVAEGGGTVHQVPVADEKDSFLATHSLVSMTAALLLAGDAASGVSVGSSRLVDGLSARVAEIRDGAARNSTAEWFASLRPRDTIIVASDPQLRPLAVLLDTSIWEAALCSTQSTDFRNLAHGRHSWLHQRTDETMLIALVGFESRDVWQPLCTVLPATLRHQVFDYGNCGRLANALSILDGLAWIEAMGAVLGIDPGKPGIGPFGREMYESRALAALASTMPPAVRHKRAAIARADDPAETTDPLVDINRKRLDHLAHAEIGGAVFDYDGTLVSTQDRYKPPRQDIVNELVRLDAAGLVMGIATGRGGSVGEELRRSLPREMHRRVTVGYYNGGHLRALDVDIEQDPAPEDLAIAETVGWLESRKDLFNDHRYRTRGVQITVDADRLVQPYRFKLDLAQCPAVAEGRVKVMHTGHSFDIVPGSSSKLRVMDAVRLATTPGREILCFGDSGGRSGNDHALLAHPFGISVGEVCGVAQGCWSLFGDHPTGHDALLKALRALVPSSAGGLRLDIASLTLDRWPGYGT